MMRYITEKHSSANIAANHTMESPVESIVATVATSQKGSVIKMSQQQFEREKMYQTSMHIFRSLLDRGIITSSDYADAERLMRKKYNPAVGTLFSDLALT